MEKSIEVIWKEGFLQERELKIPVINDIHNQKSQFVIEKVMQRIRTEYRTLIPLSIFIFFMSWGMGNNPLWGLLSGAVCLVWYFIGKKQYENMKEVHYEINCYDYLISFQEKLKQIFNYNLRLSLLSIPVLLTPMLGYTCYEQTGKSLGEVLGINGLDIHCAFIFLLIPLFMVFAYFFFKFMSNIFYGSLKQHMETLIHDMEQLRDKE